MNKKKIIISAVNLVEAGTLAILRDCLSYLSKMNESGAYDITAVVHSRHLADYPNIEYIETKWPKKRWVNRLWYEYVSMKKLSKKIGPVFLWFSLHDTTPNVIAERRSVYCHNSFSFYRWKWIDWLFTPRIPAFALLTKYIYKPFILENDFLVVQQQWFRDAMSSIFKIPKTKIIVAPPAPPEVLPCYESSNQTDLNSLYSFIFPASPNSHKNYECICKAVQILEERGIKNFKVTLTIAGTENAYAEWLYKKWGHLQSLCFAGFMTREQLYQAYNRSNSLIFPSKAETWGMPITEFSSFDKPMLLSDLPYAYETAAGASKVSFFNPDDSTELADKMQSLIEGNYQELSPVPDRIIEQPSARSWEELFGILLDKSSTI